MTDNHGKALQTVLAYHEVWRTNDIEQTMGFIADDIVCDAPAGRLEGAAAFRGFVEGFSRMLKGAKLTAAFGDDESAVIIDEIETAAVPSAPSAGYFTVRDGKITRILYIFDRVPYQAGA